MNRHARFVGLTGLLLACVVSTGCRTVKCPYLTNRFYDFRDTFVAGVGITAETKYTGPARIPALGLFGEAFTLGIGAIGFGGVTAELDGRGTFVGVEKRIRTGFPLIGQTLDLEEMYGPEECFYRNLFKGKDPDFPWLKRMETDEAWGSYPAKKLYYEGQNKKESRQIIYRGWQHWGNVQIEAALSEPFILHHGAMLKLGIDLSEAADCLLGWFGYDFRRDDMTREEFEYWLANPGGESEEE